MKHLIALALILSFAMSQPTSAQEASRVQAVIDKSENHFKLGELNLKDRNYDAARVEFDKAVDAVLESGMDVRANPRLQNFYLQLVERISQMEAQIRNYATPQQQGGILREQQFTPSPLDELSRLELTPEETTSMDSARTDAAQNCQALVTVRARAGETIAQVAVAHGVDAGEVARLNAYAVEAPLAANQMIKVPAKNSAAAGTAFRKIALRGFRLGMAVAEVKRQIPFLRVKGADAYGRSTALAVVRGRQATTPALKGVGVVAFAFLDDRVSSIFISYNDAINWGSIDEFAERTSEALRLPKSWTRVAGDTEPRRYLICGDVRLTAEFVYPDRKSTPLLRLDDAGAARTFRRRLDAAEGKRLLDEERKKREFKP